MRHLIVKTRTEKEVRFCKVSAVRKRESPGGGISRLYFNQRCTLSRVETTHVGGHGVLT